jgi:hypothetical protein
MTIMNLSKSLSIFALFLSIPVLILPSCQKKGCIDSDAINYDLEAKVDDESCIYQAENVAGTYQVTGYRVDFFGDTVQQNYTMIINQLNGINITLSNLGNTGETVSGTVKNNQLAISPQALNLLEFWQGSGIVSGQTISMQYTEDFNDWFFTETAVKQ